MISRPLVFIVETGDYSDRYVVGVYSSREAAVAAIKAIYGPPYIVAWEGLPFVDEDLSALRGHFTVVPGYSTEHDAVFDITPYEVDARTLRRT